MQMIELGVRIISTDVGLKLFHLNYQDYTIFSSRSYNLTLQHIDTSLLDLRDFYYNRSVRHAIRNQ